MSSGTVEQFVFDRLAEVHKRGFRKHLQGLILSLKHATGYIIEDLFGGGGILVYPQDAIAMRCLLPMATSLRAALEAKPGDRKTAIQQGADALSLCCGFSDPEKTIVDVISPKNWSITLELLLYTLNRCGAHEDALLIAEKSDSREGNRCLHVYMCQNDRGRGAQAVDFLLREREVMELRYSPPDVFDVHAKYAPSLD